MTRELVEWRLVDYLSRLRAEATGDAFECVVISNQRDPIIKLPSRAQRPDVPSGETDVRLPDGAAWRFRFMKEFCNVARPLGTATNLLPDLLRRWFGPDAGRPGTGFRVRFTRSPDGWWVEPASARVVPLAPRGSVVTFPSLRAAAGHALAATGADRVADAPAVETVRLPLSVTPSPDLFAVRVVGDSMAGGDAPIRDGDWAVLRWARAASLRTLEGRIALVEVAASPDDASGDAAYVLKRVVRDGDRWVLASDSPVGPTIPASADTTVIAILEQVVRPEDLAPAIGERIADENLPKAFGLATGFAGGTTDEPYARIDGQLFLRVTQRGSLIEPDRVRSVVSDRRPGETAFVLTRATTDEPWRYAGVGRALDGGVWSIPPVDFATWRALGEGRDASRRLPEGALDRARDVVRAVLRDPGVGGVLARDGKRLRIVGEAARGGLRIDGAVDADGAEGGFAERTVSLLDIAWVLVAADDVRANGGVLDEARVNRLRYLEGTPKGSTRWIDTGWALVVVGASASRG